MIQTTAVPVTNVLRKILRAIRMIIEGLVAGLGLNFAWHHFLAVCLGWGDSAPDWYLRIQETVFLGILLSGLIGWAMVGPRLDGYLNRLKKGKALNQG